MGLSGRVAAPAATIEREPVADRPTFYLISSADLDVVLERARAEKWRNLALVGPYYRIAPIGRVRDLSSLLAAGGRHFQFDNRIPALWERLRRLPDLTSVNLTGNDIGDDGAKAIAASLTGLTSLDLRYNNIGADGAKAILGTWASAPYGSRLKILDLTDNPGLSEGFPKELFGRRDAQATLAAYRQFQVAATRRSLKPLNELKLLVVGNEAVGKTSLLRYLIHDTPRDPGEERTPGIFQHEKIEIQGWSPQACDVTLNVWDFGGQEMMRGTHRFFLTERSLYLLVLEDRRQDDRSIHEWMKTIRSRGGDSPVIVVINKSDEGKQDLRLDEGGLAQTYANIVGILRTSCDPGAWAKNSIGELRRKIVETTINDARLKHVRDPIPENWLRIKDRVAAQAKQRSVLPLADFAALCRDPSGGAEPVTDENEQRALLGMLHDLGTIVAHGIARGAPAARREVSLLDPNWLTGAVYRVLEKARSVDLEGEFSRKHLLEWLDPGTYPPERHEFILDMMMDPEIGLCFRLPAPAHELYLAPEALPASRRFSVHGPRIAFASGSPMSISRRD